MEVQCSPFGWESCYQEEGTEEWRHALLYTTLDLETTILSAKEMITSREEELAQLKDVLRRALQERDEAEAKCRRLVLDKLILQQQLQKQQQQQQEEEEKVLLASQNEENEYSKGSESDENYTISSPNSDPIVMPPPLSPPQALPQAAQKLGAKKPLPEKGKLLQAVMEAGPLLQNLLLAGPLPQWQHPPPQLTSTQIPPVAISPPPPPQIIHQESCISSNISCLISNKRSLVNCDGGSDSSPNTKYQKVLLMH